MLEPWHAVLGPTSDDEDALRRKTIPGLCLIAAALAAMTHLAGLRFTKRTGARHWQGNPIDRNWVHQWGQVSIECTRNREVSYQSGQLPTGHV